MKSISELMEELGFQKNGTEETQKAFLKHLIREANRTEPSPRSAQEAPLKAVQQAPQQSKIISADLVQEHIQLAFDLSEKKNVS